MTGVCRDAYVSIGAPGRNAVVAKLHVSGIDAGHRPCEPEAVAKLVHPMRDRLNRAVDAHDVSGDAARITARGARASVE